MKKLLKVYKRKIANTFRLKGPVNKTKLKLLGQWNKLKGNLHSAARMPKIKDRDIWWASLGENMGVEINGKSALYSRPVLVLKKLSKYSFMCIPLTSQTKDGSWYVSFTFHHRTSTAVLSQAKVISVYRLHNRMGTLDEYDYNKIKKAFRQLYCN